MKYLFVGILVVMTVILLAFLYYFSRKKTPLKLNMFMCFIPALIVMIANMVMALTNNETVSLIAHTAFFISMGILCVAFLAFCIKYTTEEAGIVTYVFMIVELFDILNLFINLFTKHAFTIVRVGEYLTFEMTKPAIIYSSHLIICYVMLGIAFLYLVAGIIVAKSIYKLKYVYILLTFIVGILLDCLYLYFNTILNWSVIVFPIICIGSYYFIVIYIPYVLHNKTLSFVADNIDNGIIAFDHDDNVVYINSYFKQYFNIDIIDINNPLIKAWTNGMSLEDNDDYERIIEDDDRTYKLNYHVFETKKNVYLGSFFNVTDLTKEREKLHEEHLRATRDQLTDVYNRDYFLLKADELINNNPDTEYVIAISDIANFKLLNESIGIEKADEVLKQFGSFLKKHCNETNRYGRLDADKFAIILPKCYYEEEFFLKICDEIMNSVNATLSRYFICHIGVYDLNEKIPVRGMCDRAILALKDIKGTTQRVAYYKKDTSDNLMLEHRLTGELKEAIENKEIKVYIQPQTNMAGSIIGGECLVRWEHPEIGLIAPYKFVPLFERNGSITDMDLYIWEEACSILKSWKNTPLSNMYLSINISAKDLIKLNITKTLKGLCDKYEVDHKLLKLEITESTAVNSVHKTEEIITDLHKEGFIVEMDDFGAGYSSLNTLKDLSIDTIKLDMAFLRESENVVKSRKIIKAITNLAKDLDISVVTEGVETKEHVEFLKSLGDIVFQGYYFYKPMTWREFEKIVLNK